jgi:hypothetical protein
MSVVATDVKGAAEVADAASMAPDTWVLVITVEERLQEASSDLADELRFALRDEDGGGVCTLVQASSIPGELVDELAVAPPGVVLLTGVEGLDDEPIRDLDLRRNRLVGVASFVILTTELGAARVASLAPNLWSLVGAKVFRLDLSAGQMDVDARLASLRDAKGFGDDELVRRAEAGDLPPDPLFAEWLVLLGRGDLLGA